MNNKTNISYEVEEFLIDLNKTCGAYNVEVTKEQKRFKGNITSFNTSDSNITRVSQNTQALTRNNLQLKTDPCDHFFLVIQEQGTAWMAQEGEGSYLNPGDIFLVDSTQETNFKYFNQNSSQLSLVIPREEAFHRFGKLFSGGMKIEKNEPLCIAMICIMQKIINHTSSAQSYNIEAFHSVLSAYMFERSMTHPSIQTQEFIMVQQACQMMIKHFRNPNFTTSHVSDNIGISLRGLQRFFKKYLGESPHTHLQKCRLKATHSELKHHTTHYQHKSIATIAYESGFNDLSTFYRQYRREYGEQPKQSQSTII